MTKHSSKYNGPAKSFRGLTVLGRAAALALVLISALLAGGCLVGNKEYDEARQKRDEYRSHLQQMHESNDILKREISEIYESCDLISNQLTVMAAISIHDRYTANLGRPILPPPLERDTEPVATGQTRRPSGSAVTTTRGQSGARSTGGTSTRSGSGSGNRASGGSRTGSSGGTRTTPPPTPPANTGGGGSIDWGL